MPRKRKTSTGQPAQAVPDSVPGVRYGEGVEHQQLSEALPPVDARATGSLPPTAGGGVTPPSAPNPDVLANFMQSAPMGALRGTSSPDEPVTAGLPNSPGAGPSALTGRRSPLAKTLHGLAQATGDSTFAELARKAGMQ